MFVSARGSSASDISAGLTGCEGPDAGECVLPAEVGRDGVATGVGEEVDCIADETCKLGVEIAVDGEKTVVEGTALIIVETSSGVSMISFASQTLVAKTWGLNKHSFLSLVGRPISRSTSSSRRWPMDWSFSFRTAVRIFSRSERGVSEAIDGVGECRLGGGRPWRC